jgi:hypothetical protein
LYFGYTDYPVPAYPNYHPLIVGYGDDLLADLDGLPFDLAAV